jgi:hypothetical protein
MEDFLQATMPSLTSKLESLSCSSKEITVRKNFYELSGLSGSHVIGVKITDRVNGNTATFYIYLNDSFEATIKNQYSYLYDAFDRRNYGLEQLLEDRIREWVNDVASER